MYIWGDLVLFVFKVFCDLELIYSYEGMYEINVLVIGCEIIKIVVIKFSGGKIKIMVILEGLVCNIIKNWFVLLNIVEVDVII